MKIRKNPKNGKFVFDARIHGRGPQTEYRTKAEAEAARRAYERRLEDQQAEIEGRTFKDAVALFIQSCKNDEYSENTIIQYSKIPKLHVLPHIKVPLRAIDAQVLKRFRDEPPHKLGPSNTAMPFCLLCGVLDVAQSAFWIGRHPANDLIKVQRRETYTAPLKVKRLKMPSEQEWMACLSRSKNDGVLHLMIRLAICAGLRIGEILGLCWKDVRFSISAIRITTTMGTRGPKQKGRQGGPKTATSERFVPMDKILRGLLQTEMKAKKAQPNDHVIREGNAKFMKGDRADYLLDRFLVREGIVRMHATKGTLVSAFTWHPLRHVFVARWIKRNTVGLPKLMSWIGHKQMRTTIETYGVLLRDRAALQSIS